MASSAAFKDIDLQSVSKTTGSQISAGKRFVEPFNRLKSRANLFRRKNYSSHLNINSRSTSSTDHIVPSDRPLIRGKERHPDVILLKRSNSMVCPQQYLPTLLSINQEKYHRNSICLELAGCSIDESSTDDYQSSRSSLNHYSNQQLSTTMSNIDENDPTPSATILLEMNEPVEDQSNNDDSILPNNDNSNKEEDNRQSEQQPDIDILVSSSSTMDNHLKREEQEKVSEQIVSLTNGNSLIGNTHLSSSPSPSTVVLRDHAEVIRMRRQCHSSISSILQHQQRQQHLESLFSPIEENVFISKQKSSFPNEMSISKISACTMTGQSLSNLDDFSMISNSTKSQEKAVQTAHNDLDSTNNESLIKRSGSTTSLSSSSAVSIQTDSQSQEKKSILVNEIKSSINSNPLTNSSSKWTNFHERLINERSCTYWVNYLGSTAIKMTDENLTATPSQAISRLKQSTQYARVLPIIGLNISSRGVEFVKHAKERAVICFHDIKTIHCACQDQDLRYFAYVTREQRLIQGLTHSPNSALVETKALSNPSASLIGDYHHYCHVFAVKSEAMSTEIMLIFGQVFDFAYRLHQRLKSARKKSKEGNLINQRPAGQLEVIRLSSKTETVNEQNLLSSSIHSPTSSSSSSSIDERKIFV